MSVAAAIRGYGPWDSTLSYTTRAALARKLLIPLGGPRILIFDTPFGGAVGKIRPLPTVGGKRLPLDSDSYLKRIVLCHHSQFPLPWHPPSRRRMFTRTGMAIKRVEIF
jgi:hypothetical protein